MSPGASKCRPPGSGQSSRLATGVAMVILLAACGGTIQAPKRTRMTTREIVDRSKPAIVRIEASFGEGRVGVGTGFVVAADGFIATNLHVIRGSQEIEVTLLDGSKHPVQRIIGADPARDLAVVAIEAGHELPILELGDSDVISAGDHVIAIGNPLGVLDYTVSDGLISSIREFSQELTVLQISAPISEGSSGGPLFNHYGEVIGVATMIVNEGQNLNFGVPSNYLRPLLRSRRHQSLAAFSRRFEPLPAKEEPAPEQRPIRRQIPFYEIAILDGCSDQTLIETFSAIRAAIELGAPLYNDNNREACFRIYEGTALRLERDLDCNGVRAALSAGLLRAEALDSYDEKAWALRDAFDGILDLLIRKARQR